MSILLVHDLLLAKKGIAAPTAHPLRVAAERHRARLHAEFTKLRIRKGFSSFDGLRKHVNQTAEEDEDLSQRTSDEASRRTHPRWIRINALRTSTEEQLATTFADYRSVDTLEEVLNIRSKLFTGRVLHVDKHIPNLIALAPSADIPTLPAYRQGLVIFQDKASCFPAYLLDPTLEDGDCLDACAAPGNKTTHLAAISHPKGSNCRQPRIWACERDSTRSKVLQEMVRIAGATDHVFIEAGQDFLQINLKMDPWRKVGALLLDPSCSGSGIIGRDELLPFDLPSREPTITQPNRSKKRKRTTPAVTERITPDETKKNAPPDSKLETNDDEQSQARLVALSRFQTKLLLHAMTFPNARKIVYSTCSVHALENEDVVANALQSEVARSAGWKLLPRNDQVAGMREWPIRGQVDSFRAMAPDGDDLLANERAEACIRCNMGTAEGTQGFFVAGFVRDRTPTNDALEEEGDDEEWEGFD